MLSKPRENYVLGRLFPISTRIYCFEKDRQKLSSSNFWRSLHFFMTLLSTIILHGTHIVDIYPDLAVKNVEPMLVHQKNQEALRRWSDMVWLKN